MVQVVGSEGLGEDLVHGPLAERGHQDQRSPAVLEQQLAAATTGHDHLTQPVDAHEVGQPAPSGGVQLTHQPALGAQHDAVRRVLNIAPNDEAAVVTEPFSEWIIERGFTGPDWERAGVRLTDDLAPYEERKLRILNGAHSLLAYRGLLAGHEHVADAFADPAVREQVEEYWASAADSCSLPRPELDEAVDATRGRFANPRIRHALTQIALDGEIKLRHRVVPVLAHAVRSGGSASAPASAIAAWMR